MATHRYRTVSPAHVDDRRAERWLVAVARPSADAASAEGVLDEVSPFGCRLTVPGDYPAGERLALRIGHGLEVSASVVWGDGGVIGCRFDEPIPRPALRQLTLARG